MLGLSEWRGPGRLPAVMRKRLVGVSHLVGVLALLHRITAAIESVEQLGRELLLHAVTRAVARRLDDPADGERLAPLRAHFDGNLIGGTADASRTDLDGRLHVLQRLVEGGDRIGLELGLDLVEGAVDDALGDRLLATLHQRVHELGQDDVTELGIRQDFAFVGSATAGHEFSSLAYFGRFAPYFERRCLRSLTPWVSRVPRMMW